MNLKDMLAEAYSNIIRISGECSCKLQQECTAADLTVRQIEYLKIIDKYGEMTFSRLAELTENSKPTITEMINRFISMEFVYREKCADDKRVSYIYLTDRGKTVARHEEITVARVIDRITGSLSDEEIRVLITLFRKVK